MVVTGSTGPEVEAYRSEIPKPPGVSETRLELISLQWLNVTTRWGHGWADDSRLSHFDIVNMDYVSAVIQILF